MKYEKLLTVIKHEKFFIDKVNEKFFKEHLENFVETNLGKIIIEGNSKLMVEKSEAIGFYLAVEVKKVTDRNKYKTVEKELTTSQIRNFFGIVKKIEARGKFGDTEIREFSLLKPKLAYAAKKTTMKTKLDYLKDVLTSAIDMVISDEGMIKERFDNFCDFFEAILCYHKASGGKN